MCFVLHLQSFFQSSSPDSAEVWRPIHHSKDLETAVTTMVIISTHLPSCMRNLWFRRFIWPYKPSESKILLTWRQMRRNGYHGRDGRLKIVSMMYGSSYLSRMHDFVISADHHHHHRHMVIMTWHDGLSSGGLIFLVLSHLKSIFSAVPRDTHEKPISQ